MRLPLLDGKNTLGKTGRKKQWKVFEYAIPLHYGTDPRGNMFSMLHMHTSYMHLETDNVGIRITRTDARRVDHNAVLLNSQMKK